MNVTIVNKEPFDCKKINILDALEESREKTVLEMREQLLHWGDNRRRIPKATALRGQYLFFSHRLLKQRFAESKIESLRLFELESDIYDVLYYETQPLSITVDGRRYTPDTGFITRSGEIYLEELKPKGFKPSVQWVDRFAECRQHVIDLGYDDLTLRYVDETLNRYKSLRSLYRYGQYLDFNFVSELPEKFKGSILSLSEKIDAESVIEKIYAAIFYGFIVADLEVLVSLDAEVLLGGI